METSTMTDIPSLIPKLNKTCREEKLVYRRQSCLCTRPLLKYDSNLLILDETSSALCSHYSTLRGFHQRIISISLFGFEENTIFSRSQSLKFLHQLANEIKQNYPDWILRIYHNSTIQNDIICSIECIYNHVDFCNVSSLENFDNYIPGKIWRFLPVGDELVDIIASRDLDSPITQRELNAVNEWISSGKAWHVMRDHPQHHVPMLGGMWGFRPELNRTFSRNILQKIFNRSLIIKYDDRGDQTFLSDHIWPYISDHLIAHDSFYCEKYSGKYFHPWPTRRPDPTMDTGCFVGCSRPCCTPSKPPFDECPIACRPKTHTDWTLC